MCPAGGISPDRTVLVLDNFCTRYERLDLGIFHQYTYASVRCPQLLLNDLQDFYETLWSVRIHNGDVHIVRNFILCSLGSVPRGVY